MGCILTRIGIDGKQEIEETCPHLLIGETKVIFLKLRIISFYRQITALVDDGNGIDLHRVDTAQKVGRDCFFLNVIEIETGLFQQIDKQRGCTRLKPVVAEFLAGQRVEQTERIVHPHTVLAEMIAVVLATQRSITFILGHPTGCGQLLYLGVKVITNLLLRHPTDGAVLWQH